jgi:hypothetical protein
LRPTPSLEQQTVNIHALLSRDFFIENAGKNLSPISAAGAEQRR